MISLQNYYKTVTKIHFFIYELQNQTFFHFRT